MNLKLKTAGLARPILIDRGGATMLGGRIDKTLETTLGLARATRRLGNRATGGCKVADPGRRNTLADNL